MPQPLLKASEMNRVVGLAVLSLLQKRGAKLHKPLPPPKSVYEWAKRHRRIEGLPFSLDRFLPLEDLYNDDHPHIVVIKPAQRGVSEFAINFTSFALEHGAETWAEGLKNGLNIAYIFPTVDTLNDFSKERLSGLEEESVHLARLFGEYEDYNAIRFKQVKHSYLYMRGGWSPRALKSFPADILILDEYDEMDPKAVALARRRMNASLVRREIDISTPTIPGFGIHEQYLRSDQRVYQQQHTCGEWVSFDFHRDVRVDGIPWSTGDGGWQYLTTEELLLAKVELHCPICDTPLTDEQRMARGRWHVTRPDVQSIRGYHIPWWPFPIVDLVRFAIAAISRDPTEVEQFYQSDLGMPYAASGARITREALLRCSAGLDNGELPKDVVFQKVTAGLDVGSRLHMRISGIHQGETYVLWMGALQTWAEVNAKMNEYKIRLCVVDALPEQHSVADFVAKFPGRVIAAGYPTNAQALKASLLGPVKEGKPNIELIMANRRVQVNRTMAMDRVATAVNGAAEHWPRQFTENAEVQANMISPVRVLINDKMTQPTASWVHTTPDHFFHACVYDYVARELVSPEAASASSPSDKSHSYHAERRRII